MIFERKNKSNFRCADTLGKTKKSPGGTSHSTDMMRDVPPQAEVSGRKPFHARATFRYTRAIVFDRREGSIEDLALSRPPPV